LTVLKFPPFISAEEALELFDKAQDYWLEAVRLAPTNYMEGRPRLTATT
jgi:hypothetical protein